MKLMSNRSKQAAIFAIQVTSMLIVAGLSALFISTLLDSIGLPDYLKILGMVPIIYLFIFLVARSLI